MSEHSFWANTLKANTTKTVKMPKNIGLVINSAALVGGGGAGSGESAEFYITINETKCLIATLNKENCPHHEFRVLVGPDSDLSLSCFSNNGASISIIGSVYPAISDEED